LTDGPGGKGGSPNRGFFSFRGVPKNRSREERLAGGDGLVIRRGDMMPMKAGGWPWEKLGKGELVIGISPREKDP